ncbi:MAG: CBS domain-containing protein [Rubrivivax sp.]|nr:CBS domain-containing protein [Rubrivivax sp.]
MNPGTRVADLMTRGVRSMSPTDTVQLAAQAMDELGVGVIPVCDGGRVVGLVTDRDIAIRVVAQGLPIESTKLSEVMSEGVECVREDDGVDAVRQRMQEAQIRRLPVLDDQGQLVGMLSLGDLAAKDDAEEAGEALAAISEPAEPDRSASSAASGSAGGGSASGQASSRRQ